MRVVRNLVVVAGVVAVLLGCGSNKTVPTATPRILLGDANTAPQTEVQIPAAARDALAQLGFSLEDAAPHSGKAASTTLPHIFGAEQQYVGPGDAGYILNSADAAFSPSGVDLAPAGSAFPDNFSYIVYRIDDVTQRPGQLSVMVGPGTTELGICAYDWAYGSRGRWLPVYFGSVAGGEAIAQLNVVSGADLTNAGNDMAIAVFCLNPNAASLETLQLFESPYDEVEDNHLPSLANSIAFPTLNFKGNIGAGGAYNGDTQDWFTFTCDPGERIIGSADYVDPGASVFIALVDQKWVDDGGVAAPLAYGDGNGWRAHFSYTQTGTENQPYYILVQNAPMPPNPNTPTDYELTLANSDSTIYDEVEPNNDLVSSNPWDGFATGGALSWDASMGSGPNYPGYDGGSDDYYYFAHDAPVPAGQTVVFDVFYDSATANFAVQMRDGGGQLLAASNEGDGSEFLSYSFDGSEVEPILFLVQAVGYGDYRVEGSIQ